MAAHFAFLLALETGLLGLFASLDVILFYIFFEFTLIPLFFLIGIWGGKERQRASVTFFLYTLAGSLLTLLGVIALVVVHYQFTPGNVLTFSIPELTKGLASLNWPEWRDGRVMGQPAGRHLPAAAGGLRDQGTDVPVPHLAAAGARRGADGRLGHPGRRAPEGGQLRAPEVQHRHDADGRRLRSSR